MSSESGAEIWVGIPSGDLVLHKDVYVENDLTEEDVEDMDGFELSEVLGLEYSVSYDSEEGDRVVGKEVCQIYWGNKEIDLNELEGDLDDFKQEFKGKIENIDDVGLHLVSVYL